MRFQSPLVAEFFQDANEETVGAETIVSDDASQVLVAASMRSQEDERLSVNHLEDVSSTVSISVMMVDTLSELFDKVAILDADQHLKVLSDMFSAPRLAWTYPHLSLVPRLSYLFQRKREKRASKSRV